MRSQQRSREKDFWDCWQTGNPTRVFSRPGRLTMKRRSKSFGEPGAPFRRPPSNCGPIKYPKMWWCLKQKSRELNIVILTFGHAGDGNIHVNIMVDKNDQEEYQKGQTAKRRLFEHVMHLSGTLSGEHGVGITKASYLSLEIDETSLALMQKIKNVFDPNNILNPGKIFTVKSH